MSVDTAKAEARKNAFACRKTAFLAGQGQAATKLAEVLADQTGNVLAGYMPMRTEIDPLPAMAAHRGVVAVPVIVGKNQALLFRTWSPDCTMIEGEFGALIPADGAFVTPNVLIVPLLAFDARGYRLGYGGGFYDRTLQALRTNGPILALGFAFEAQEVEEVPIDANDERLDGIVTEQGLRLFRH